MQFNLIFYSLFFLSFFCLAQNNYDLTIKVNNLSAKEGFLHVSIYNSETAFLKTPTILSKKQIISSPYISFDFKLPSGKYAIAIFQDENSNDIFDKNIIGFPSEPYAFSNNIRKKFNAPKFTETMFELNQNKNIEINIKKWP